MYGWPEELKEKTTLLLRPKYKEEKQEESLKETNTNTHFQVNQKCNTFASCVFGFFQSQIPIYEELSYYLDEIKTLQALPKIDPFE
jgi:hypothetical protein